MIGAFFLIGLGVLGIGVFIAVIGMFTDKDAIIKTGIIILIALLGIVVLSSIIGGIYMLRR